MTPRSFLVALIAASAGCSHSTATALPVEHDAQAPAAAAATDIRGWLTWRGPDQNGTSREKGLPETIAVDGAELLWSYPMSGRGTPVIANGRVYTLGYEGEAANLQEVLLCLDESTGARLWEHRWNDFLSDVIYNRYSLGSPAIDPRTGDVFVLSTAGVLTCLSGSGELRWQRSMMEELGRMTFPNGRTGGPVVDGDLVIVHSITSSWGAQGPARDRFHAFDATSGKLVWDSTPGDEPKDNPLSLPVLEWRDGRRVLYCTTGCGHLVCLDARTGAVVWRYRMAGGGMNSSVVLHRDAVIAIHGRENVDSSSQGRMVAVRLGAASAASSAPGAPAPPGAAPAAGGAGAPALAGATLDASAEKWRNDLSAFSSSPVLAGDRIYQTEENGELCCVDASSGQILWRHKLAPDQIHASPAYGDGKLYVPMNNGSFHVVRPTDQGAQVMSQTQLDGNCLGAPAIANGRVYVHTTSKLYCFGTPHAGAVAAAAPWSAPASGSPARLQIVPCEMILRPGEQLWLEVRELDEHGWMAGEAETLTWTIEPGLDVTIGTSGQIAAGPGSRGGAGTIEAALGDMKASARVRIIPVAPLSEDFESVKLAPRRGDGAMVAFPPPFWIGGRLKWEVQELEGSKVLAKTLDRALFQRVITFIGHPAEKRYTMQIDIMSDGSRRMMSSAGVLHQRYLIALKGNHQELEISSNDERIKHGVPFAWSPKVWYRLKSRVDLQQDGSALVRAKAWKRDDPEPEAWTIEFRHRHGHTEGAPGLFGFAPQSRFSVYVDNVVVGRSD